MGESMPYNTVLYEWLSKLWSLLGSYCNTAPNIMGTQKGTIVLITTFIYICIPFKGALLKGTWGFLAAPSSVGVCPFVLGRPGDSGDPAMAVSHQTLGLAESLGRNLTCWAGGKGQKKEKNWPQRC